MRNLRRAIAIACLLASFNPACSREQSPPSQSPLSQPPPFQSPPVAITGRERLWWHQQAPDAGELRHYSFVLYVDALSVVLPDATCGVMTGEDLNATCSSPLPPLQPGQHTLALATRITRGVTVLEGERSAPLVVIVAGAAAAS